MPSLHPSLNSCLLLPPSHSPSFPFPPSLHTPTIKIRGDPCRSEQSVTVTATVPSHLTGGAPCLHGAMAEDDLEFESEIKTLEDLDLMMEVAKAGSIPRYLAATEAFNSALKWMEDPTLPPERLSLAIQLGDKALQGTCSYMPTGEGINLRIGYGLLVAEILAVRMQEVPCVDEDTWEPGVVHMLQCLGQWKIDPHTDTFREQSHILRQWTFRMMQDAVFCPKVSLRVHVLSLVSMWSYQDIQDPLGMSEVLLGLISICSTDKLDPLLPTRSMPTKLLSHFVRVLMGLQRWGHMNAMCTACNEQAALDHVGPEMLCLLRISEVAGEAAVEARHMERVSWQGSQDVLYVLGNVMAIFSVLIMSGPVITAFEGSCLAESAAASLVKTTAAALACMPRSFPDDYHEYVYILTVADVMMFSVNTRDELRDLKRVMHISHFYTLGDLYDYSKIIGYPFRRKLAKFNEKCNETSPDR